MYVRHATIDDIDDIMDIYVYAKTFMAKTGNSGQWASCYPDRQLILQNIEQKNFYVCQNEQKIAGVFFFSTQKDDTYAVIEKGQWLNDKPYGVIHRIAVAQNTKGIGTFCINWALQQTGNVRIDTHENNMPMRNLLRKLGFCQCGIIYLANGNPRLAFQKTL